jgi:succinate dehydrogenase / fumarate reductase cytochrome b subunit
VLRRAASLFGSTVGQKIIVAVTGIVLLGFVFGHMAGNLKVFEGAEGFDAYARFCVKWARRSFPIRGFSGPSVSC